MDGRRWDALLWNVIGSLLVVLLLLVIVFTVVILVQAVRLT